MKEEYAGASSDERQTCSRQTCSRQAERAQQHDDRVAALFAMHRAEAGGVQVDYAEAPRAPLTVPEWRPRAERAPSPRVRDPDRRFATPSKPNGHGGRTAIRNSRLIVEILGTEKVHIMDILARVRKERCPSFVSKDSVAKSLRELELWGYAVRTRRGFYRLVEGAL